jgi:hypothetical protein
MTNGVCPRLPVCFRPIADSSIAGHATAVVRLLMYGVLVPLVAWTSSPAPCARVGETAKKAARIERECGLKKGTIAVAGNEIHLQPGPDEAYAKVDCALTHLKNAGLNGVGFIGNEADPNAILKPPLRYIVEGTSAQIAALANAAKADKWVVSGQQQRPTRQPCSSLRVAQR